MYCLLRVAACALISIALMGQENLATVRGTVRDSGGHPLAAVTLQLKTGGQALSAKSDSQGCYRFSVLPVATYTLRAELSGQGDATFGPFALNATEEKIIELTLAPHKPELYDQPTFIVAGVTDGANRGGHGSDVILRSSETLTKATASLGDTKEPPGDPLTAVREYQHAAEQNPNERNFFDWGAELLAHRANVPAIEVFTKGNRLFPRSTRMLLGLAVAHYSNGSYDEAAQRFFESAGYLERMARFATIAPDNAWANFYYASSFWKHKGDAQQAEALLKKALHLDPKMPDALLQLGIIYSARKDFPRAIAAFEQAIAIDPRLEEAHYRLAQAYTRTGENQKAQKEFATHHQLVQESSEQTERERREVQQFVIQLRTPAATNQ
jgi:tetratricopeptide (TPR) repeat protein